jgi:Leucine rich repeat variant
MTADLNSRSQLFTTAADPNTDPARLLELVGMNDPEIAAAIAGNPNISPEILENLLPLFPDIILANPAIVAMEQADPEFLRQLFGQNQRLLKTARFSTDWSTKLLKDPDPMVRSAMASNPHLSPKQIQHCMQCEDVALRQGIAANPSLAAGELEELSYDPDGTVRWAVVSNPHSYPKVLDRLAKDPEEAVRTVVASSLRATPETLLLLSTDATSSVRRAVAANPHSSPEALKNLTTDPDPVVAQNIANHAHSSADLLAAIAQNPDWTVKTALASNVKTPVAALIAVAESIPTVNSVDSFELRQAIAQNPNAPDFILHQCLVGDDIPSRQDRIFLHLSRHLNTPDELLDRMADHDNMEIQTNVVNHPNIHHPTLVKLASSRSWPIQQRALERINASPAGIDRQTYIAEPEASIKSGNAAAAITYPSQPFDITLLSAEEVYDYPLGPSSQSSSLLAIDTNWGTVTKTGFSQLYDRTGEHLSAMHPLALLLTMLSLLCVGLGLTLWVKSVPPEPIQVRGQSEQNALSATSRSPKPLLSYNYNQAINTANAATIASQTAVTKKDWEKVNSLWKKAIALMESVPTSDHRYADAQSRAANYKNILNITLRQAQKASQ